MMASGLNSAFITDDLFLCTICFNEFDQLDHKAKLLPCHHTFCQDCLTGIVKGDLLKCPVCADVSSVTNVKTLKNNHYLAQFADILQNINNVNLEPSDHRQDATSLPETDRFCRKHGNTEKFFWCKTCTTAVCVHCMGLDHKSEKGHEVDDVSEATDELRRHVLNTLSVVNGKINNIKRKKEASQRLDGSIARRAVDAIQNSTSASTTAIVNIASDSTLNPNSFASKYNSSCDFLSQGIYALNRAHKELKDLLGYFMSMERFVDQKFLEAENVKKGRIVLSILHPDTKFDYGKVYCVRCGEMCQFPEAIDPGKANPYGVPTTLNLCSKCNITILEFS